MQYTYLQPLKVLDEVDDDDSEAQRELEMNGCIEGPALMPIKEEFVSKDLRSYFLDKGQLFDEPDSLPIIWLELPAQDDFLLSNKKRTKPTAAGKQQSRPNNNKPKRNLERKVPCKSCDRKFVTVGHMKIHAATHLRNRKKSCLVCGRKFSHGGALCLHMRSHKLRK